MANITLAGTIHKEPETRFTSNQEQTLSFALMVYTGGNKEKGYNPSAWFSVVLYGDKAKEYEGKLHAKDRVTVTGRMNQPTTYQFKVAPSKYAEKTANPSITAEKIVAGDTFREPQAPPEYTDF